MPVRSIRFVLIAALVALLGFGAPAEAATKKGSSTSSSSSSSSSKSTSTKKKTTAKSTPTPSPAFDANGVPIVKAAAVIVIDADTGRVLHDKNADVQRQAASTQKLLTALIVAESGDLNQRVVVQESDTWAEPSKLYLKPGDVYTRQQLLEILLVRSMNDVARCLARDNAGSIEAFASKMNRRARELGATSSNFVNPNGLPMSGQYSTARDLSRIAFAAYRNRTIRQIVCTKYLSFQYADGRLQTFENTNRLLGKLTVCNGMKTGYTDGAGKCLIASARTSTRNVIAVLLGDSTRTIWADASALLLWGLSGS